MDRPHTLHPESLLYDEDIHSSKDILIGESFGGHLALSFLTRLQEQRGTHRTASQSQRLKFCCTLSPWIDL
jgi:hypothetical protein